MTVKVLRPVITLTTVLAVLAAALAVFAFTAGTSHADSTFKPTLAIKMCNALDATFSSTDASLAGVPGCADNLAAGAHADFWTNAIWPTNNLNFSNVVTLAPNTVPTTAVPVGTKVGGLRSATTLGLINGPCNTALTVDFVLWNVGLPGPPGSGTARGAMGGAIAWPQPEGTTDRFGIWKVGGGTHTSNPPVPGDPEWAAPTDTAVVATGTGVNADGTSLSITQYPSFLLDAFDADFVPGVGDGAANPTLPFAAYGGLTKVSGNWIPLYFLAFASGGLAGQPAPLGNITAAMGQPSVSVLNDPTAVIASASSITDFCSGASGLNVQTTLLGNPGGNIRSTNPAGGTTGIFEQYNASQRDTDQDGWENQIDTCPTTASGDPTSNAGDSDADGIKDPCDGGATPGNFDVDTDGFQNRQDDCPNVGNATQVEADLSSTPADKGPATDGIGDACDSEAGVVSVTQNGRTFNITMSDSVSNGRYMTVTNVVAKCFTPGTDADGDGYCVGADGAGGDTVAPGATVKHNLWSGGLVNMDSDGDGKSDALETYMGTDPTKSCSFDATLNNEAPFDNWAFDLNDSGKADIFDVSAYSSVFGKYVLQIPAATTRFDLNSDGKIDIFDVSGFSSVFGKTCAAAGVPAWSQQ